ncbi:hypothetical protein M1O29_02440 [Dehalococcoidia bacterium]|nr:hypothetical protein [Dehalococcoidia bacterium]
MGRIIQVLLAVSVLAILGCSSGVSKESGVSTKMPAQGAADSLTAKLEEWQADCPQQNFDDDPVRVANYQNGYRGPLFDAHVHLVGSKDIKNTRAEDDRLHINRERADEIFDTLGNENVIGLIGFLPMIHEYFVNDDSFNAGYQEETIAVLARPDNKITPFIYPRSHIGIPPKEHGHKLVEFIDQNIKKTDIPFKGIGEIHTSYPQPDSYESMRLIDPEMFDLYDYAAANGLIVMIHPQLENMGDLRSALSHNPRAIFLLHGLIDSGAKEQGISEALEEIFENHSNVYFSVDAALMLGYSLNDACIHDKKQFMANLKSDTLYTELLSDSVAFWKPAIEAYPSRMMWGTDLQYWWHYEPDVFHEIVEFGRHFISYLEPTTQEQFAYRNVVKMLTQ